MSKQITFTVDERIHRRLKIKASKERSTMGSVLRSLVNGYLSERSRREPTELRHITAGEFQEFRDAMFEEETDE